jgi:hypothetical protein
MVDSKHTTSNNLIDLQELKLLYFSPFHLMKVKSHPEKITL